MKDVVIKASSYYGLWFLNFGYLTIILYELTNWIGYYLLALYLFAHWIVVKIIETAKETKKNKMLSKVKNFKI